MTGLLLYPAKHEDLGSAGPVSRLGTSDSVDEALAECCYTEQSGHDLAVGMSAEPDTMGHGDLGGEVSALCAHRTRRGAWLVDA